MRAAQSRLGLALLACVGCVGGGGRRPPAATVGELRQRSLSTRSPVQRFVGEARFTYFGKEGRVRATASVAVARPASFRLEVLGPHGGVLQAAACNGQEVFLLDVGANHFAHGRATPDSLDGVTSLAPLHLEASAWVGLFFGEVDVPDDATVANAESDVTAASWEREGRRYRATFSGTDDRLVAAENVGKDGALLSRVRIDGRDARGLPEALHIEVPSDDLVVDITLRDIDVDPQLPEGTFVIDPPRGATTEHL